MNALLGCRGRNGSIRPQLGLLDEAVRGITQRKTVFKNKRMSKQ